MIRSVSQLWLVVLVAALSGARADAQALLGIGGHAGADPAAAGAPVDRGIADLVALAIRTRAAGTRWQTGKPLSEALNAHSTNMHEHMRAALEHGYNFLEGDVRQEINEPHELEMRHDTSHESGNNLTLRQWLEVGRVSGRGLKLDVKEPQHMDRVLAAVETSGVPEGRLMFNLGASAMDTWGARIRARFPGSWLALNPSSGDGALNRSQVDGLLAQARAFGAPATFVIRYDDLTDEAIARLKDAGPVSVWNSQNTGRKVDDVAKVVAELRARGVNGVIDIRKSEGLGGRISNTLERGVNEVRTRAGKLVGAAGDLLGL